MRARTIGREVVRKQVRDEGHEPEHRKATDPEVSDRETTQVGEKPSGGE